MASLFVRHLHHHETLLHWCPWYRTLDPSIAGTLEGIRLPHFSAVHHDDC
jgi:hypothetical protein